MHLQHTLQCNVESSFVVILNDFTIMYKKKLRGFGPLANYADV
jgi:hypothetical protein